MTKRRLPDCNGIRQREPVKKPPVLAANRVEDIAETSENTAVNISIRNGLGSKADWLVSVKGVCTDTPMRDRQLRRYRRFCNVMEHRFKIKLDPMPEADWAALVRATIAKADAL